MHDLSAPKKPLLNRIKPPAQITGMALALVLALASCATSGPEASGPPTKIPVTVFAAPIVAALVETAATATPLPIATASQAAATPEPTQSAQADVPAAAPEPAQPAPVDAPAAAPAAAPATPSQPEAQPLADANYVNVRSAPSLQAAVVARVLRGGFARIIGRNAAGDWYIVEYAAGATGYVKASAASIAGDVSQVPIVEAKAQIAAAPAAAPVQAAPAALAEPQTLSIAAAPAAPASSGCPSTSGNTYTLIPRDSAPADRPDTQHGDLNLALRGYGPASDPPGLVQYNGGTDPDAPQFSGVLGRMAAPVSAYRVNIWRFESASCGGATHGCRGPVDNAWPVTLLGLASTPGEAVAIPSRNALIYSNAQAMLLFADERRITLGYTRQDTIAAGYAVYIDNICVDPNLLALYRAQVGGDGYRSSGALPGLRNGQPVGTAAGGEVIIGVRDNASWMDPRSRKDWWQR